MPAIELDTPAGPIDALLDLPQGQGPWPGVVVVHDAIGYQPDKEAISARIAVGLVAGFAGLLVVALPGGGGSGAALSMLSATAITAGTLLARRLGALDLVVASGWHFLLGGTALFVWAAAVEGWPGIDWTPRFVAVLGFLSLVGTAAAYLAWFAESRRCPLGLLAAWTFLVPVAGVAFAAVLLDEAPDGWTAAGIALVLGSLWVVPHPRRDSSPARTATVPSSTEM